MSYDMETCVMRLASILVAVAAAASTAAAPPPSPCCDLWIFEPAGGLSIGYAIEVRGSGAAVAVEEDRDHRFRLTPDGRGLLQRWRAASQKADASSILIDAATSSFRIGPFVPGKDADPEALDSDTLVLIRGASPARARRFVDDIDNLPADMKSAMRDAIPARGG